MDAQQYLGMRLLLIAEQTAGVDDVLQASPLYLDPVQAEDGRVSFRPALYKNKTTTTTPDGGDDACVSMSLKLKTHACTGPTMVLCKMTGGGWCNQFRRPVAPEQVTVEERVILPMKKSSKHTVASLSMHHAFQKVTVLFMVYDLAAPRTATGAGLQLNRARLEGALCDVKLVVEGVELPAHRAVLAARSPVLSNMLTGDFKEARDGRVELVDSSRAAVEKFLDFLYTDHIEDWQESELELLQLADKYMVSELRSECRLRLWSCDPLRALEVLYNAAGDLCNTTISSPLRQRLTFIVVDNMEDLASTKQWDEFKRAYPLLVDIMLGSGVQRPISTSVCSPLEL